MGIFERLFGGLSTPSPPHVDGHCACEPLMATANQLLLAGDFQGAERPLRAAVRACPANPRALGNLGVCLIHIGRLDEAMQRLDAAIAAKPDYASAWENKGVALARLNRHPEALSCLARAAELNPGSPMPRLHAGRLLIQERRFDEALAEFDAALRQDPGNRVALTKRALAMHEKGDGAQAEEAFAAALRAGNPSAELLNNFGTLREEQGAFDEAAALYRRALLADPRDRSAKANLSRVETRLAQRALTANGSPRPSAGTLHASLDSAMLSLAREMALIPPGDIQRPDALVERGQAIVEAMLVALQTAFPVGQPPQEAILLLFDASFEVGVDDAYKVLKGPPGVRPNGFSLTGLFERGVPLPSVPPGEVDAIRRVAIGVHVGQALARWTAKNRASIEAASVDFNRIVSKALLSTYLIGLNHGRSRMDSAGTRVSAPGQIHESIRPADPSAPPRDDSVGAMAAEAVRQGWLDELRYIPELAGMYKRAAQMFIEIVDDTEPGFRETLAHHCCRYLFAKGVEGVILWGPSAKGHISVDFQPRHLVNPIETDLPPKFHALVVDALPVGEQLFAAHQRWVMDRQTRRVRLDLRDEVRKVLEWAPRFGISYALSKGYQSVMKPNDG